MNRSSTIYITESLHGHKVKPNSYNLKNTHRRVSRNFLANVSYILTKRRFLIAILLFITFVMAPPFTANGKDVSPVAVASPVAQLNHTITEIQYLSLINDLRSKNSLNPLIIDSRLTASAGSKATDMVNQKYWGHYSPGGVSFADYIWNQSPSAEKVGENLAKCFESREQAFSALVASPTHYAIMTGNFTNFGVSEVTNLVDKCRYTVFHFAEYK